MTQELAFVGVMPGLNREDTVGGSDECKDAHCVIFIGGRSDATVEDTLNMPSLSQAASLYPFCFAGKISSIAELWTFSN